MIPAPALLALLISSSSAAPPAEDAGLRALRAALGESIEFTLAPHPTIRYCPDNTCEAFRVTEESRRAHLVAFATLYLWYVSDYAYLAAWRGAPSPPEVQQALSLHAATCSTVRERERVACALGLLASQAGVQVFWVRFDEGHRAEERVDLNAVLARWKSGP